ncbi:DUF2336 domain-containing protein [Prosthecomicrobium sp. N25]|uniref:DUF2336 domain-containing protein n=1 Tax=Prosthecomicrobium sp. N25 TaxID=3129254 RepID=UPI00307720EC
MSVDFATLLSAAEEAPEDRRGEWLRKIRDAFVTGSANISESEIERFDRLMTQVLDATPLLERVTFAKAVAKSPRLPQRLRKRLLSDNSMVAAPIIEHAHLTDDEIIRIIDINSEAVCLSIARREPLSDHITDLLIGTSHPKVLLALARNIEATLSPSGFEILSDVAVNDVEMDDALSARPDLPPEIARKLTRALEKRTRQRLTAMMERDLSRTRRPFVLR